MFTAAGLFSAIPCPYLPRCPRESFCIYSHVPIQAETLNPTGTALNASRSKRKPDEMASEEPAKKTLYDRQQTPKSAEPDSPAARRQTPLSAMESAKRRRQDQESLIATRPVASTTITKRTQPAVLLARPQVNQKASVAAVASNALSGPPILKIDLRAHSKPQFRQAVAMQYYNEFLRIYAPLAQLGSSLATTHAIDQEKAVHQKTNVGSYRSLSATTLVRLKKRPVATRDDDVGIDGVWVDPSLKSNPDPLLEEVWKRASEYVQTLEELGANEYPLSIPEGASPELDPVQVCDRCQKQFEISDDLDAMDKTVCLFHDRRIRTKTQGGEKIKHYPCCDAPQGGPGCREGPHVFKEDDFLSLHGRTPFIETPTSSGSKQKTHSVVAVDCEMCYTTGGFELARISVVGKDGKTIMDELVKPKHKILDLNSRYSGILSLEGAKYDLAQARERFLELIDKDTMIIGHSLENDFKVMRLIHKRVIDTAMSLARQHLHISIQNSEHGHDSFEDAKTCLDLVRLRIEKDHKLK
ncbi:RNA exonuclease 3 [Mortierella sp. GBA30]|nr:RNA exonuclease 3 [Mortierella sp. GBA30]